MQHFGLGNGSRKATFASAVEAGGWLHVSGQVAMRDGEVIVGGIQAQARLAIENLLAVVHEAGYQKEDIVRCGVCLDDPRDYPSFNRVFREYFDTKPPARVCIGARLMVDCKIEIDCVAYKG